MERDYFAFYETLCERLEGLELQKAELEQEIREYEKFEDQYYATKNGMQNILVDIGEGCFMQAEVEGNDVKQAFVHIGLGIHVQFNDETSLIAFVEKRRTLLQQKIVYLTTKIEMMQKDVEQMRQMLEALAAIT